MREVDMVSIEQAALDFLLQLRKEQKLTEAELGQRAFPESSNPWAKVHSLWNTKTATKKSLRLRLGDFCSMCQAMGKEPDEVFFKLWQTHKNQ